MADDDQPLAFLARLDCALRRFGGRRDRGGSRVNLDGEVGANELLHRLGQVLDDGGLQFRRA